MNTTITLSEEQQVAVEAALSHLERGEGVLRIGGYAGTGKTTMARTIVELSELNPAVCAFTGKACSVLRRKGMESARTIHSTIYTYDKHLEKFVLNPFVDADYFLVDEGSMVARQLWEDLRSYGKPIIVIGDPGQLEPVGDDPRLMHDPEIVLENIHRQAEGNAIIEFANKVRKGRPFNIGSKGEVDVLPGREFWSNLEWADHVLCGFNKTRVDANERIRRIRGHDGLVNPGERIIVLQNNTDLGVFNGMMLHVDHVGSRHHDLLNITATTEDGETIHIPIYTEQFGQTKKLSFMDTRRLKDRAIVDYGYCTTVHKFQGSEADKVLVADQQCDAWDEVRWRYTAITRAAKELRYCI